MSAVTHVTATASTANSTSYASGSFTPPASELLIVVVAAAGTNEPTPTLVGSANSLTFDLSPVQANSTANTGMRLYTFIAEQATPSSPVSMTVTFDCTGDTSGGTIIMVESVSGLSRVGQDAALQIGYVDQVPGGTSPTVPLSTVLTANPTIYAHVGDDPGGVTAPSGMTERVDTSIATPPMGASLHTRDSGFTGTSLALTGSFNGHCCAIAIEVDSSASGAGFDGTFESPDPITGVWYTQPIGYSFATTPTKSSTFAYSGTYSMRIAWPAAGAGLSCAVAAFVTEVGHYYRVTARVRVPTGDPSVKFWDAFGQMGESFSNAPSTGATKDSFVALDVEFTATETTHFLGFAAEATTVSGDYAYIDDMVFTEVFYDGTFETGVVRWIPGGTVKPAISQEGTEAHGGTKSMKIVWGTGGTLPQVAHTFDGLTIGLHYYVGMWVKTPAGTSPFLAPVVAGVGIGSSSTVRGSWQLVYVGWTATATSHSIGVWPVGSPTGGDIGYVDDVTGPTVNSAPSASGTIAVVSGHSGNAVLRRPASGSIVVASGQSGNPTRVLLTLAASGTIPVVTALSGNAVRVVGASGTVVVVSSQAGDAARIAFSLSASGTITLVTTVVGDPTRILLTLSASGTIPVVTALVGDAIHQGPAAGTVALVTTLFGGPTITDMPDVTAGTIAIVSALVGDATIALDDGVRYRLVLPVARDDHQRPEKGPNPWERFHYPPTQLALLLYVDGTVISTWTLHRPEYVTADAVAGGGTDSIYSTRDWEWGVLTAAGYTFTEVSV